MTLEMTLSLGIDAHPTDLVHCKRLPLYGGGPFVFFELDLNLT